MWRKSWKENHPKDDNSSRQSKCQCLKSRTPIKQSEIMTSSTCPGHQTTGTRLWLVGSLCCKRIPVMSKERNWRTFWVKLSLMKYSVSRGRMLVKLRIWRNLFLRIWFRTSTTPKSMMKMILTIILAVRTPWCIGCQGRRKSKREQILLIQVETKIYLKVLSIIICLVDLTS